MNSQSMKWGKIAGILGILGAILILVSVGLAWYTITTNETFNGNSFTVGENFNPGSSFTATCTGSSFCSAAPTGSHSYSSQNATNEGNLYGALFYLLIGSGVLGLIGAALTFVVDRLSGILKFLPLILVVVALLMGIGGVAYVAAGQPAALNSDTTAHGGMAPSGSWPGSSFIGSSSTSSGTMNWGPGAGFYLGIVAVVMFLISMLFMFMAWKAMKANMPAEQPPMAPPASPPGGM
ncbi:MAG: hypothetical protein L3K19_08795 [Thermoplasmata archaeon]|nr:hypothetical protein [Thermoplasmata archaeon]